MWIHRRGLLDQVLDVIRAEVVVGNGYPYAIETADSLASPIWSVAATIPADRFPRMMAVTYSLRLQEASRFFRLISDLGH